MDNQDFRTLLITAALPYANGPLHLGHMVGYIQADMWTRFQRMRGNTCWFVSGDDAHGTPIMLHAEKQHISPETLITQIKIEHERDFADFAVAFDNFHTTHSEENKKLVMHIYERLRGKKTIQTREIQQAYDPIKEMFLPDRYIKGTCPRCKSPDQYGDSCEVCGATYSPTELIDARSVISGASPIEKSSLHFFFDLPAFTEFLQTWTTEGHLQTAVAHKLEEWFATGLQSWDISRDSPYFGFEIPNAPGKYFYVWLDAPIGYMASLANLAKRNAMVDFDSLWNADSTAELHHFIGKDIIYFHALFWPAVLKGSGYRLPTSIHANGFLTLNGQKMSKSRGTFITARAYLQYARADYLRYYFAAKSSADINDLDLNLADFVQRVNSDLVGKVVNIASRCSRFIHLHFADTLSHQLIDPELFNYFALQGEVIADAYEARDFARAMREIMQLADRANQYIDQAKPWQVIKEESQQTLAHDICTQGLNLFRQLIIYLQPVIPQVALDAAHFLNCEPFLWSDADKPLLNHIIHPYQPLLERINPGVIDNILQFAKDSTPETKPSPSPKTGVSPMEPIKPEISIDDFNKLDLRVAKIIQAENIPEAEKLLKLIVELGDGETRQIFAGIKSAYDANDLIGEHVVIVANLAPRTMRFGVSQGMVLAAGPGGKDIWVIKPASGAIAGMRVK